MPTWYLKGFCPINSLKLLGHNRLSPNRRRFNDWISRPEREWRRYPLPKPKAVAFSTTSTCEPSTLTRKDNMLLKIRIEIQLHDRATRHVDDKNPVIHAAPLTMARQLTWIMNGRLISNQLSFACSGYGGSSHSRWARTTFKARHWSRVFLALRGSTILVE